MVRFFIWSFACSLLLPNISFAKPNAAKVNFSIRNIRNSKGVLRLALFNTQESFESEKPFKSITIPKDKIENGMLQLSVDLPDGNYGITVLDDENNNAKMDYNLVGMPKEGFGFSNYYHSGFSKPGLSKFTIVVKDGVMIQCKMRYI